MGWKQTSAGGALAAKYRDGLKEWRRRSRPIQATLLVLLILVLIPSLRADFPSWLLGAVAGALVGSFVLVRDSPPDFVERLDRAGTAERMTAKALRPLVQDGYLVCHDIPTEWGNWDHVVVGPGGVFLIDTKLLGGTVRICGDEVLVTRPALDGFNYTENLGKKIRGQAASFKRDLSEATQISLWVRGVACFWNEFPERSVEGDRVQFIHGSRLADWIRSHPSRLKPDQYRAVVRFLNTRCG